MNKTIVNILTAHHTKTIIKDESINTIFYVNKSLVRRIDRILNFFEF